MKNTTTLRTGWSHGLAITGLAAALTLAGCGVSAPDEVVTPVPPAATEEADQPEDNAPDQDQQETENQSGELAITPAQAAETALEARPDSRVVSLDLERTRGITVWEVEVVTTDAKYEVEVDAATGAIVKDEQEHTSDLAKHNRRLDAATLTHTEAIDIALELHPGATLVELDLDDDNGGVVWEIDVVTPDRAKYELEIDATTGKVLKNEYDD